MDDRLVNRMPDRQQQPVSPKQQELRISDRTSRENEVKTHRNRSNNINIQSSDDDNKSDREQQQAQTSDNGLNDDSKPKRNPFCSRCRNHGKIARVKGHKRHCEFKVCQCDGCKLVEFRQIVSAAQIKRRRYLKQDEECGRQIEITPPVLARANNNEEDPASLIAKSLTGNNVSTNATAYPMKHIHQHMSRPTTQQLLSISGQQQQLVHNDQIHQQNQHHEGLHDHQRQRLSQAQIHADMTSGSMSVAAVAAAAAIANSPHQQQPTQNTLYPFPFFEVIANHANETQQQNAQLQKFDQVNQALKDPKSVLHKLHPLGAILNQQHGNNNNNDKQDQSAKTCPLLETTMIPSSTATKETLTTITTPASCTQLDSVGSNYQSSTMLNTIRPCQAAKIHNGLMGLTSTSTATTSEQVPVSATATPATAISSSNSSTVASSSTNGSINQLPPTPTSANPTPMTSTFSNQQIHPNTSTTTNTNTNDNNNNNNNDIQSQVNTYMNTLLMPNQREKLQLVEELHQRYGPSIVYSWLNAENFDIRKVLNIIENSQPSFNELMNSRLKYHLDNKSSSASSRTNSSNNDNNNNNINNNINPDNEINNLSNDNFTNLNNIATSNNQHHNQIQNPLRHHQHHHRNHNHQHQIPQQQHHHHHHHHQQQQQQQQHHQQQQQQQQQRLPINYPSSHSNVVPHFIDHILSQNNQNQMRSAHYNIGNLFHQDHYQLLHNHLHNNPTSQLQMDITQALLNTSSSTSSMSTIL